MQSIRPPLMEGSDNGATSPLAGDAASRRRSGRVVRVPDKFAPEVTLNVKRKRGADLDDEDEDEDEDEENEAPADDEQPSDGDDAEPGDEDAPPRRRRNKPSSQLARSKKPAAKKPKTNGASSGHPANLPSRPKKAVRVAIVEEGDGLYADVFGSRDEPDDVVTRWYTKYRNAMAPGVADLVNCVLLAAGCDQEVTVDDINDPDNCSSRLAELQGLYEDQHITDYPLISRAKTTRSFRERLVGFFASLIKTLHETDVLYNEPPLMDNIVRWVASMSSSTLRPFRHTATTVALAMQHSLAKVAGTLDQRTTVITQQIEAEKKRQAKNKAKAGKTKLAEIQRTLDEANQNRETCGDYMREFFDMVYVHRYRDVDPRLRTECVEALGSWIWVLPNVYMEPEYLRYLGWMLSDIVPSTRQEVLKQLARVFKRDAEKLGHFIDRFRPRLIEMATKDSDAGVRVAALSVITNLRSRGMLEPDEIDMIGRLMFDSEARIRKAAVTFFDESIKEVMIDKVEAVGGEDAIQELFSDEQNSFDSPRADWLNVKCLGELMAVYEAQLEAEHPTEPLRGLDAASEMLSAALPETRISLASQSLFEKISVVQEWGVLAGYLLYDHSVSTKTRSKSKSKSAEDVFREAVAPSPAEEAILLEVLTSSVKASLAQERDSDKHKKKVVKTDGGESLQEDAALHVAILIPKLLRKFGAEPGTATIVMRLEHALDLDVFQQLRQDSTTYARLLDEICTQFDRHVDKGVVSEATAALLHARKYDELEEITDAKVSNLWETTLNSLRNFDKVSELSARRSLEVDAATELSNILFKISKLASISDCVEILETKGISIDSSSPAIDILVKTVHRGQFEEPDDDLDDIEDGLAAHAIRGCQFYFMWKVRALLRAVKQRSEIPNTVVDPLSILRKGFELNLVKSFSSRAYNDDLRLFASGSLCDLCTLFGSLNRAIGQPAPTEKYHNLGVLIQEVPSALVRELISILDRAERSYAKRAKKTLNEPAEDEDPLDDDQLSDDEASDDLPLEERRAGELTAERALCEFAGKLVLVLLAKMADQSGPNAGQLKRRLLRNQAKLGPNYKEIVSYLDEVKLREALESGAGAGGKKKSATAKGKEPSKKPALSERIVLTGDDDGDDDDDDEIEDPFESPEPEEGTVEDLRRRGLLEDPIEEPDEEDRDGQAATASDDGSILGD